MTGTRSRVPLERDGRGRRILTHGDGGYKRGCGCPPCLDGHAENGRKERKAKREERETARPALAPASGYGRDSRRSISLSEVEVALLDEARGGASRSEYMAEAVLARVTGTAQDRQEHGARQATGGLVPAGTTGTRRDITCTLPLTAAQLAQVDRAAADAVVSRAQYMREPVMDRVAADLGIDPALIDTARRDARAVRRPNRARQDTSKQGKGRQS